PVTIPAATTVSGKKVPGSVEAAVTADAIGPEYNVGLVDFKVPGLKGDPRYDLVEARTKPQNPIQGGFNGTRNKVEEKELAAAREKVRDELKTNLIKELEKYIPKDYIMPTNAYVILYESLPDIQENNGVKINERATFHGYMFKKAELARELALKVKGANTLPSEVSDVNKLVFTIQNPAKEPWNSQTIGFTLKGSTSLVATVDTDKLKQELLGKPRTSLNAILASYPSVARAQVTMRPFWKKSFPATKDEITITIANPLTP
ncbi:MAG: hypothetical protein M3Q73_03995, partial [bacterium]|nr:hypothetical protein [bacterium]